MRQARQPAADAAPQYMAVTAQLRTLLQAPTVFDLPAVTERRLSELRQHRTQLPQMRALVQQLCTTLAVADADELLPAVLQLQSLCEHAGVCAAAAFSDASAFAPAGDEPPAGAGA